MVMRIAEKSGSEGISLASAARDEASDPEEGPADLNELKMDSSEKRGSWLEGRKGLVVAVSPTTPPAATRLPSLNFLIKDANAPRILKPCL